MSVPRSLYALGVLLFATTTRLLPSDSDEQSDVYRYDARGGTLTQVSLGGNGEGNGPFDAAIPTVFEVFAAQHDNALTPDGERAFISDLGSLPGFDGGVMATGWLAEHPSIVVALVGTSNIRGIDQDAVVELFRFARQEGSGPVSTVVRAPELSREHRTRSGRLAVDRSDRETARWPFGPAHGKRRRRPSERPRRRVA